MSRSIRRMVLMLALCSSYSLPTWAQVLTIPFGAPGDVPVVGDWDNDDFTRIGVYRPSNNTFYLRLTNTPGPADVVIPLGAAGDQPIAIALGNSCGSAHPFAKKPGVYRPSSSTFFIRCVNRGGFNMFALGTTGDIPVIGGWSGNGSEQNGVYRPSTNTFFLGVNGSIVIPFGAPGDLPVAGDNEGFQTLFGVYRPSDRTFYLRTSYTAGNPTNIIPFGDVGDIPLVGDWTGDGNMKVGVYRPSTNTFYLKTTFP